MWSIIQAAGWPIWPLIFASIIALALIFERLWSLRQSVVAPTGMVDHVLVEYRHTGATQDLLARTAEQGPLGRILAAGLANGISIALYNTAMGLIVAIPSMIFYRHFRAKVDALVVEMEQQAIRLVDFAHNERK